MDEIFDRIKSTKIQRKTLARWLITAEILGILVFVWFLRIPLSQKFLESSPNNYSINSMDSNKQYLFRQGDFLSGQVTPNSTLQIWFAPDGSKNGVLADSEGNFSFQIPPNARTESYQLIIANDNSSETEIIKDLKIRIQSNNKIYQFLKSLPFL